MLDVFLKECQTLISHALGLLGDVILDYLQSLEHSLMEAGDALLAVARGGPNQHSTWYSQMGAEVDVVAYFGDAIKPYNKDIQTTSQVVKKARDHVLELSPEQWRVVSYHCSSSIARALGMSQAQETHFADLGSWSLQQFLGFVKDVSK